ncbi:hypothetical protein K438DRAFT_693563 [Mycena galopus ATCC 62051]|nr:hypothetical protein K438DRAFT_693563 [Mycena galopus ATCC 62051]
MGQKRRRTIIACSCCRRRKIRCITSEQPPINPCTHCKRKSLNCEYVAVADPEDYSSSSPRSPPAGDILADPNSPLQPTSWTPPVTSVSFCGTPPHFSPPPNTELCGVSSPLGPNKLISVDPIFLTLPPQRRCMNPPNRSAMQPESSKIRNNRYDVQAMQALQYLSSRASRPHSASTSSPFHSDYFADYIRMPPAFDYTTASNCGFAWSPPDRDQTINLSQG